MAPFKVTTGVAPLEIESSDTSTPKPQESKGNTRVRFAPTNNVRTTLGRWQITDDEKGSLWYSNTDMTRFIKGESTKESTRVSLKSIFSSKSTCSRGLETFDAEHIIMQELARDAVLGAVLHEQHRQRRKNMFDDVRIAVVSLNASRLSRKRALSVGALDAKAALSCHGKFSKTKPQNKIVRLIQKKTTPVAA
uniref:Uncharacterized protein n=1 Tax=Trieres chinensis TaxID=1514140 RepID=A0A7S1ZB13_TRICV|mmetsp:Transcript_21391/g.43188  ORF Transcript_21391/g.43188 Transcript_21391/m.43188 type:complete len:193 (+) Transcript_21391:165-743(+)